jgi:hypothetical protein
MLQDTINQVINELLADGVAPEVIYGDTYAAYLEQQEAEEAHAAQRFADTVRGIILLVMPVILAVVVFMVGA